MASNPIRILASQRLVNSTRQSPDDIVWRQFVIDHREVLKRHATVITVTPNHKDMYKYRLMEYLMTEHRVSERNVWVNMFINNLLRHADFVDVDTLYIVSNSQCDSLWKDYELMQHTISSAKSKPAV